MLRTFGILAALMLACACQSNVVTPRVFREICQDAPLGEAGDSGKTNAQDRVIAPGMQISVYVAEDASLNRTYPVPLTCGVDIAGAGQIRVCGLTTSGLAAKLKTIMERD